MDSKLDPVYRALFRHAEHSGDRQDVHREEAAGRDGRKKEDRPAEDRPDPWQDDAAVSVGALRALLLNLLGAPAPPAPPVPPPAPAKPVDPASARAAGAYRSTASHAAPPPATPATSSSGPAAGLTPDDIRAIQILIVSLDRLSSRQVEMLRIEKNGTFLQSLAVAAAKALGEV